jgi:hypothetical protein
VGVEQQQVAPVRLRSKRTLMKTLGVVSKGAAILSKALEKYAGIFSTPLSATQIKALAALFGWSSLDGLERDGAALVC